MSIRRLGIALARVLDSLSRDAGLLRLAAVPLRDRVGLIYRKYALRVAARLHRPPRTSFRFAGRAYYVAAATDAALLQRVIVDTHDCLELFGLSGRDDVTVVDVGAHNGETVIALSLLLSDPQVHAFEPDPVAFANARRNAGDLAAAMHPVGLSDRAGQARFDAGPGSGGEGTFVLDEDGDGDGDGAGRAALTALPIARGDDVLEGVTPDLVKIDVEGYERHVIDGLRAVLARSRFLSIEMSLLRPKDHHFHEIAEILAGLRFELVGAGTPHAGGEAVDLYFRRTPQGARQGLSA